MKSPKKVLCRWKKFRRHINSRIHYGELIIFLRKNFQDFFSDMIAPNSTDRQWYLNRISGKSCKVVQSNENLTPEFQESPKPFNPGCYTIPELITVILTLIGRAE